MNRSILRDVGRAVSWHRRKLAVVAAVAAVLTGLNAAAPPTAETVDVITATAALPAGLTLGPDDVQVTAVPVAALPDDAVRDPAEVVGRTLVAATTRGAILTGVSVLTDRTVSEPGQVIAPVRLADPAVLDLVRVGDRVDVVSAGQQNTSSAVVARNVRVITVPQRAGGSGSVLSGGGNSDDDDAKLVLVAVSEHQALALAQAATGGQLSVLLH